MTKYDEMGLKEDESPGDRECTVVGHIELPKEEPKKKKEFKLRGFNRPKVFVDEVEVKSSKEVSLALGYKAKGKKKKHRR